MPSNSENEEKRKVRLAIARAVENFEEINILELEWELLKQFSVPDSYPRRIINKYLIERGTHVLKDEVLRPIEVSR